MSETGNHAERAHSPLGASASERWMNCTASIRESAKAPEPPSSVYAVRGTAAHQVVETCLDKGYNAKRFLGKEVAGVVLDQEDIDAVQVMLDYVRKETELNAGDVLLLEQRLSLQALDPPAPMFGTGDVILHKPQRRRLRVIDYKHGSGVAVEIRDNPQLRYYALGALLTYKDWAFDTVEATIVQPRAYHPDGPIRSEVYDVMDLLDWSVDLIDKAAEAMSDRARHNPGAWCRWCPALDICPAVARRAQEIACLDFAEAPVPVDPDSLSDDHLVRFLEYRGVLEHWMKAMAGRAVRRLQEGAELGGWKLVPKRAIRQWTDPAQAEIRLKGYGLDDDDLFTRKLLSPAQAEKLLRKDKAAIRDLVVAVSTGATLAPPSDPRPALPPGAFEDVSDSFTVIDNED